MVLYAHRPSTDRDTETLNFTASDEPHFRSSADQRPATFASTTDGEFATGAQLDANLDLLIFSQSERSADGGAGASSKLSGSSAQLMALQLVASQVGVGVAKHACMICSVDFSRYSSRP